MATALVYHQANQSNADWCVEEMAQQRAWWEKWRRYFSDHRAIGIASEIGITLAERKRLMGRLQLTKDAAPQAYAAAIYALREHLMKVRGLMARLECALDNVQPVRHDTVVSLN